MKGYDVIGDIHGCSITLEKMLSEKLGYKRNSDGTYHHINRQAIFLGDFIDRGPYQKEVISIVQSMIKVGAALSVMGNHEYNAIAYATRNEGNSDYLRPHTEKNYKQHEAFLVAYADDEHSYKSAIEWFKTLPLWLDLEDFKVIHACWDREEVARIKQFQNDSTYLSDGLLHSSCVKSNWQYNAIETLLKGKEVVLPNGQGVSDKEGNVRHEIRVRWWDKGVKTYKEAFVGPEHIRTHIPEDEIIGDHLIEYSHEESPVFLGHYWLEGEPEPLSQNIACTDYSVAKPGGKLAAYRWDGEKTLNKNKFVTVDRVEKIS